MKSVKEYIKVLEDIESSDEGGEIKGPFTVAQLIKVLSTMDPNKPVQVTMNMEYQGEINGVEEYNDYVLIGDVR